MNSQSHAYVHSRQVLTGCLLLGLSIACIVAWQLGLNAQVNAYGPGVSVAAIVLMMTVSLHLASNGLRMIRGRRVPRGADITHSQVSMFTVDGYLQLGGAVSSEDVRAALLALSEIPHSAPIVRAFTLAADGHLRLTWGVPNEAEIRVDIDQLDDVAMHLGTLFSATLQLVGVESEGAMQLIQAYSLDESSDDDDNDVGLVKLSLAPLPPDLSAGRETGPRFH